MTTNNYTLGRGEVHFSRFKSGGQVPAGFFYIGNTPEFNLTIEQETLDHYSSDGGIREKDDSVPLEVNRTGSLVTDAIKPENVALFFFGEASSVTDAGSTSNTETFDDIKLGHSYKIGVDSSNPAGIFGIDDSNFTAEDDPAGTPTTLTEGTDYTLDADNGVITILEGATNIAEGGTLGVTYDILAHSRERVISGSEPVEGAMMYISANPKGTDVVFYMPYVKVSPNGDYALKGDEWQQIPLSLEILKPTNSEAIYRDGTPAYS